MHTSYYLLLTPRLWITYEQGQGSRLRTHGQPKPLNVFQPTDETLRPLAKVNVA